MVAISVAHVPPPPAAQARRSRLLIQRHVDMLEVQVSRWEGPSRERGGKSILY